MLPQVFEAESHSLAIAILFKVLNSLVHKCFVSSAFQFHIPNTEIEAVTPRLYGSWKKVIHWEVIYASNTRSSTSEPGYIFDKVDLFLV